MKLTADMLPPPDPQAGLLGPRALARGRGGDGSPEAEGAKRAEAARQFEGLLLTELMKVMRKSAPMLEGGQGKLYMQMFDSAIAEQLSKSGGVGLSPIIERSLGGGQALSATVAAHGASQRYGGVGMPRVGEPVSLSGKPGDGHMQRLQAVASDLILSSQSRWAKAGSLTPAELASDFQTGDAHFNVEDAQGYEGHPKCNLFAFEVARRAGFQVPVVARPAGWGFPSADTVTEHAAEGQLPEQWGRVVTGVASEQLSAAAQAGQSAFVLAGSGQGERLGHMAVVERIHSIEYDDYGRIQRAVFDGWEARTGGAQHLTQRTWNRAGTHGGHLARSGFGRIEIIELKPAAEGGRQEIPLAPSAPPSFRDDSRSSDLKKHPIDRSEDAS